MSPITIAWSMAAAACGTMALAHVFIWLQRRGSKAHLLFSLAAAAAGANAFVELSLMRSRGVDEYLLWLKLQHVAILVLLVSLSWFVVTYFDTPRRWPAVVFTVAWAAYTVGVLVAPFTLIYSEISGLREVRLPWGEIFYQAVGTAHPLRSTSHPVVLTLLAFFADASWSLWRRGDRRRAVVTGGSLLVFGVVGGVHSFLVDTGALASPYLLSFAFLTVVVAMGSELTRDVVRAGQLSDEVKENERRWRLLAESVQLLVVALERDQRISYVNPYVSQISGYPALDLVGRSIHDFSPPGTREEYREAFSSMLAGESPPRFSEMRFLTRQGEERTVVFSAVRVATVQGETTGLIGVGTDVTEQRRAEAARDEALARTEEALREVEGLRSKLEEEVVHLRGELRTVAGFDEIVGRSDALLYVLRRLEQVAPLETTVLIQGETGVGKELIARAIHTRSKRSGRALVKVDCTALPPSLIEDELFGHERGAFTGADRMRRGRFELAEGGTVFLDEVGELPLELQGKLLRIIQDGEFERVGGDATLEVDVRLIAATNRTLRDEVRQGRFREDLFYRLNVFPLTVPPLRQRRDDIPLLVEAFVHRYSAAQGKQITQIPQPVLDELVEHEWPGNIRELSNVIENAVITSIDGTLRLAARVAAEGGAFGAANDQRGTLQQVEKEYVEQVLKESSWRIEGDGGAAQRLGLHPNTLRNRMRKLGIRRPDVGPRSPSAPD